MKRFFTPLILALTFLSPSFANAQTEAELKAQLIPLMKQLISMLQAQIDEIQGTRIFGGIKVGAVATTSIESKLSNKTSYEKANIKATEIVKLKPEGTYTNQLYGVRIEAQKVEKIDGGIQVFARAWSGSNGAVFTRERETGRISPDGLPEKEQYTISIPPNTQLGFGADGSVEIERFKIYNPPILVLDPNGSVVRTWNDDGETKEYYLREDPVEATAQSLAHTISVVSKTDTKIEKGKVGNTTSTFYPAAGAASPVDGRVGEDEFPGGADFATIIAASGDTADVNSATNDANPRLVALGSGTTYEANYRGIWGFDTSTIPDTDTISSATFGVTSHQKLVGLGDTDVIITPVNPAADDNLTGTDYGTYTRTNLGSKTISTFTTDSATYNDFALNATGIAYIDKTGITFLGGMLAWDFNESFTGSYVNGASTGPGAKMADTGGTSADPALVIIHSAPVVGGATPLQDMIIFD